MKILLALLLWSGISWAEESYELDGIDITSVVKYFAPYVTSLNHTVTVYNWSQSAALGDSPAQVTYARRAAKGYWYSFGGDANGNMYGMGLYAATDPIISMGFGALYGQANREWFSWRLLQMQLPVGFKLYDMARMQNESIVSEETKSLLLKFFCPAFTPAVSLFEFGGQKLDPRCQKLVQKVFRDIFQIDGFAYVYGQFPFPACQNGDAVTGGARAFVMTDGKWMTPQNTQYFTSTSTKSREDRIRIQTAFLNSDGNNIYNYVNVDPLYSPEMKKALLDFLNTHPLMSLKKTMAKCEGSSCELTVTFCSDQDQSCENLKLGPIPRDGGATITAAEAIKKNYKFGLLWTDLEGEPKTSTFKEWLLDQRFGCNGKYPYETPEKP